MPLVTPESGRPIAPTPSHITLWTSLWIMQRIGSSWVWIIDPWGKKLYREKKHKWICEFFFCLSAEVFALLIGYLHMKVHQFNFGFKVFKAFGKNFKNLLSVIVAKILLSSTAPWVYIHILLQLNLRLPRSWNCWCRNEREANRVAQAKSVPILTLSAAVVVVAPKMSYCVSRVATFVFMWFWIGILRLDFDRPFRSRALKAHLAVICFGRVPICFFEIVGLTVTHWRLLKKQSFRNLWT